jgi:peptide/nickel transport system substrate-binding protein
MRSGATLLCVAITLVACSSADAPPNQESSEPQRGGTAVIALETEPPVLNPLLLAGLHNSTFAVAESVLSGAYQLLPDTSWAPDLIVSDPEMQLDPFRLTYVIKPEAEWNDGTPVSAEDFEFTWQVATDPKLDIGDRAGYELIESADILDDKTIVFTFGEPFAPFKQLFNFVLPRHVLEGENFEKVWNKQLTASSGAFKFESWQGSELSLVRNEEYWGPQQPHLDELLFNFIADPNTQMQSLKSDEVDVIAPRPSKAVIRLRDDTALTFQSGLGLNWEHLAFQHEHPLIGELFIRQALAHAIDRRQIVEELLQPLHPDAAVLDNLIYLTNQAAYEPGFDRWEPDADAALEILESNGCQAGEDDIYVCDGERLSFEFTAASDDPTRELVFEVIQEQLRQVGIEVKADFRDPNVVYSEVLPTDAWDMFAFAWTTSGDPAGSIQIWGCDGGLNFLSYCDSDVDSLLDGVDSVMDPVERATRYNAANELMAESLPALPLYQNPVFLIHDSTLRGPTVNPTNGGPAWNAHEWFFES